VTVTQVLLISGSTRGGSTNTAALRTASAVAPAGVSTAFYSEMAGLPAFNPDDDHDPLPTPVAHLRAALAQADALLVCTPEYAGALPGAFKNLLDWTVGDPVMDGKPVAWVNVASIAAPTGGAGAHGELATVLGYLGADIVPAACTRSPMSRQDIDTDGLVGNAEVRVGLSAALRALDEHVRAARPSSASGVSR
jgi:chromate reductase, NAD(P)H dehydrogenase (quinone)